jgi:hypothetical protein
MQNLGLILLVFSFVMFVIGSWRYNAPEWNRIVSAGLAFLVAAELFGGISALHYFK